MGRLGIVSLGKSESRSSKRALASCERRKQKRNLGLNADGIVSDLSLLMVSPVLSISIFLSAFLWSTIMVHSSSFPFDGSDQAKCTEADKAETKNFIYFYLGPIAILLWKTS